MSEAYVEHLVKRKTRLSDTLISCCLLGLTIGFAFIGLFVSLFLMAALIFGLLFYFVHARSKVEYEYCYLDKEISIDRITNMARRKKMEKIDMERVEIIAPMCSHQLDSYRNRTGKVLDYSTGYVEQPDKRYMIFYDGTRKIIFEPNTEMLTAIRNASPRKVFLD